MHETEQDRTVSKALKEWTPNAALPPRFHEQVWQRIARDEAPRSLDFWETVRAWLETRLSRPALAVGYMAVLLCTGVAAGYWHARSDVAQTESDFQARYIRAVDPYLHR